MKASRLGKVDHVFPFVCNGVRKLTIEGRDYYSSFDETRFPVRDGSVIEYSIERNEVTVLAVQPDLLEVRTSGQPLFDNTAHSDLTGVLWESVKAAQSRKIAKTHPTPAKPTQLPVPPEPVPDKIYVSDGLMFGLYNGGQPPYFYQIHWDRLKPVKKVG
jgi:hypothetical protein